MKLKNLIFSLIAILILSCTNESPDRSDEWKAEIVAAEKAFAKMAQEDGIEEAFLAFADDNAVLKRGSTLVVGKSAIAERFNSSTSNPGNSLSWVPDFVDVSSSGDLGYTYGQFIAVSLDSLGNEQKNEGYFHTVWKRQKDGRWKYVWD